MPQVSTIRAFIELVEAGQFIEAMEDFYHTDATAQENLGPQRIGLPALLAHERRTLAAFKQVRARAVQPVIVDGSNVAINWLFEFDHPSGTTLRLDEVAVQHWSGERLARERFYYDPGQMLVSAE